MNLLDDGYVVDVPYPTFVHRQAMPVWLKTVAHLKGVVTPDLTRPYRYLELGCAMGIHLHLTAAANPIGHFVGVDFNAEHLAVADEGLKTTGIDNIEFIQASFAELLEKEQEPFDFIVTHGVWSWISEENQKIVVDIINKLLKPNGILYVSYMSHPGATGLTSVQKLMFEMSRNLQGDSAQKASQSLALVRHLGQSNVGVFAKIPELNQELELLVKDKPSYIAHDFLSQHWQPQHSADMIRLFGNIHMSYLAGAGIMENMDMLTLPPEVRKILKTLPLVTLQETVKDMARYSLQRQDIYIREKTRLDTESVTELYDSIQFGLLPDAPVGQDLSKDNKIGMIRDVLPIFEGILRCLAQQKHSILGLHQQLKLKISLAQFSDVVLVLVWAGYIHPLRFDDLPAKAEQATNQWMSDQQLDWHCNASFGSAIDLPKL